MPSAPAVPVQHQTFQTQTPKDALTVLGTSPNGLAPTAAASRLLHEGQNQIQRDTVGWPAILARQFGTPLVGLLIVAGLISFFLHDVADGVTIVVILAVNGLLGFLQEFRSGKSLEALEHFLDARVAVVRGGSVVSVPFHDLVRGDIVFLRPGDKVPADLRLIETYNLGIDESTLTGETAIVPKDQTRLVRPTGLIHECHNFALAGTFVRRGQGRGVVIATGSRSILGSTAELVTATERPSTFEGELRTFSRFLISVVVVALALVFIINLTTKGSTISVSQQLLFALALAVSVIPEALPAVTTITLSRGALHLAKRHVVVRRLSAIEDLGHIDILCTDKTGTLTENRPSVARVLPAGDQTSFLALILAAIPPSVRAGARDDGDPFDTAIIDYARHHGLPIPAGSTIGQVPFDPERRRFGTLIRNAAGQAYIVSGAPESIIHLCSSLTEPRRRELLNQAEELGRAGERVIAFASREVQGSPPDHLVELEHDLTFRGFITFVDPIKATTRRAILEAERLGVAVKIVTGDSPGVAAAVAIKLGLIRSPSAVMTGDQLAQLSAMEYRQAVRHGSVFARMSPIQKYDLIKTLEETSSVGFLGEGINDAPALKLASVSLVVQSASDIAREAADIVLLDKSLHVVVDGIREGRAIFANVLKYVKYTLVGNFGNFFAIAGISLLIDYLPMLPIQILLTNLLTDLPLVAVAGDYVNRDELRRPQHFRLREIGFLTLLLGMVSALFDFIFFGVFSRTTPATVQTLWFVESILSELVLIYSLRTTLPVFRAKGVSPWLLTLTVGAGLVAVTLPLLAVTRSAFHFITPTLANLSIVALIVIAYFIVTEAVKQAYYRSYRIHEARFG